MGQTVMITGAAGGLGRAVVAAFDSAGWRVVGVDRADGDGIVAADLMTPDGAQAAVAAASDDSSAPLRAVAHLVGGFAMGQEVADTPVEEFEAQFRLNLRPAYLVAQAAFATLRDEGAMVVVSSQSAWKPFAGAAGYCASKAALLTFAEVLDAEGLRCNAVLPSMIDTPANRAAGMTDGVAPELIAQVIRFLCSPESAATRGAAVKV